MIIKKIIIGLFLFKFSLWMCAECTAILGPAIYNGASTGSIYSC